MPINLNRVKYEPIAHKYADQYGVPRSVMSAIITRESKWDPAAVGTTNDLGIAQFIPGTAKDYGITDRLDPLQSLEGAAKYLRDSYREFGNWPDAIRSYNAGREGARAGKGFGYLSDVRKLMDPRARSEIFQGKSIEDIFKATGIDPRVARTGSEAAAAVSQMADRPPQPGWLDKLIENFKGGVTFVGFGVLAILLIISGAWRLTNE